MANESLVYTSSYGATRSLTAAQKLAELACERIAAKRGATLVTRFWQTKAWQVVYTTQLRHANSLLKLYDQEAVMKAFREQPHVFSLGAPFFHKHIADIQSNIDAQRKLANTIPDPVEKTDTKQGPRQGVSRPNSARNKLREI